jgi:outer membrane protein assembly factor BamB
MTQEDVPLPGSSGGGNGLSGSGATSQFRFTPPVGGYVPCETWINFWLEIKASSNMINITISNTLPGMSYILLETTSLNHPDWVTNQTLTATSNSIAVSPISAGTNKSLFFQAVLTTNDEPPFITVAPSNQVVLAGNSAVFTVTATGLEPLSYQWQLNGNNISDATTDTLTIGNVQTNNVGSYTVIVSNVICTASAEAGLGLTWSSSLGAGIDASPAIGPDGTVYIQNSANTMFALDPVAGAIKWATNIGSGYDYDITSSAAVAATGSAVYVGSLDGTLYALNATNGSVLWSKQLGSAIFSSPAISASDGTVYAATYNSTSNGLFAVNPLSGAIEWFFQTDDPNNIGNPIDSSPAVGPDCTIYFLASTGDLYAVSPNGALQWFFPLPAASPLASSPAIGEDGTIYVGSGDGYLYAISPSGTLKWIFDTADGYWINSSPAIGGDGTVYIASADGNLYAVTNGILKWGFTNSSGSEFISSPAIAADGTVYIGSYDDNVYAITNGAVKWVFPTGNMVISSPAIAANGAVYIGSEDGNVYSLPGSADLASSAWPMFHENPRHTGATPNPSCLGGAALVAFPNNASFDPSDGQFSFQLSGTPGSLLAISASSNLTDWSITGSVSLDSTGVGSFTDTNVAGVTNRFYLAQSGNSCSQVIGFINMTIPPGTNLIANQLYQVNDYDYPQNTALGLLDFLGNNGFSYPPDQTEIMKWNGQGFDTNTYNADPNTWSPTGDAMLLPGEAAFITNATELTIPFVGLVLQGVSANPIVAGTNYVSSIVPQAGRIQSDLRYIPNTNDQVLLWTGNTFSSHTYTGSNWSGGEPVLGVGQGFVLVASQTNIWVQSFSACQPGVFVVTANPLWTDTGLTVTNGQTVYFSAAGTWNGGAGDCGPGGLAGGSEDPFLATAVDDSLIAFVGPNPYYWGATNEWGNSGYFPQGASTNGYWPVGTIGVFTTDRTGELWFGFNDDAVYQNVGDNSGSVAGQIQITNAP